MLYFLIKWLHVMAAIAALGSNMTFGFWIVRASREPGALSFTLRTIKFIDDRIANPSYGVLLLTGLAMVWVSDFPFHTPWLELGMTLYFVTFVLGVFFYTPTLKRQIAALERSGMDSPEYQAAAARGRTLGMVLGIISITIVFLMVVKPTLWG